MREADSRHNNKENWDKENKMLTLIQLSIYLETLNISLVHIKPGRYHRIVATIQFTSKMIHNFGP